VGTEFEERGATIRQSSLMNQRALHQPVERAQRRARSHRVGGVRRDQYGRPVSTPELALEVTGNFHGKKHLSGGEHPVELVVAVQDAHNLEIPSCAPAP
jgi:dTDP-4-dehydrorhamnose reductase